MRILGLDPGVQGGAAVLDVTNSGVTAVTLRMPAMKLRSKTFPDITSLVRWCGGPMDLVVLELPRIGGGARSSATTALAQGIHVGGLQAAAAMMGWPIHLVTPVQWQQTIYGYERARQGISKKDTIDWCRATYPSADLVGSAHGKAMPSDGIADAIALAHCGRMMFAAKV